ncbi:unnamed protein product [Brassicogethes aeneus]|uniref:tRNA-specific adenosine deaminase 1 n=1 Tax=Brassicogethes aeneus TaxID=1431903 RepID=A0A9P0ATG8_BRAAE|nr:unnamed protein product [Brassicogethes aeneus]
MHETIANLCLKHFNSLPKKGKPIDNEWTVLSCIVLEENELFEVVALGTGSKCIGQNKLSPNGDILNDSHAEIICRRSFIRFLYDQLNLLRNKEKSVYLYDLNREIKIKPNVKFHFFTTHVPCGDAAIFSKQNEEDFGSILISGDFNDEPKQKKLKIDDIYRTGAKCLDHDEKQDPKLDGSAYHILGAVRRKPGRGDPTLSVSCSDKISRWVHLGIQGSLIFTITKQPIYISSFTIAGDTPFNEDALKRALFNRFGDIKLPLPFVQNKFIIGQATLQFKYAKTNLKTPCPSSISWVKTDKESLEVSVEGKKQGITKKDINKEIACVRICKKNLFGCFINTIKSLNLNVNGNFKSLTYKNAKTLSEEYVNALKTYKDTIKVFTTKSDCLLQFKYK